MLTPSMILAFAKLDLGRKYESGLACSPCGPEKRPAVSYPSLWLHDLPESLDALPASGKAVVEYKIVSRTTSERDGVKRHSGDIEIQSIDPVAKARGAKRPPGAARPLKLSPGMLSAQIDTTFFRTRDSEGQFAPESGDTGPTPQDMARAYGPGAIAGAVGLGVAAGAGGSRAATLVARKFKAWKAARVVA